MSTATRVAVGGRAPTVTPSPRPKTPPGPSLRAVPSPRPAPKRGPFVAVVLTMLVLGLGGLLVLNTVLAQDAFRLHDLEGAVAVLTDQEQALQQQVARLAAPARLTHRARAMGMVPMAGPAFLRTSDGAILGRPAPAPGTSASWAATAAATPVPAPTPTATPKPSTGQPDPKANPKPDPKPDPKANPKPDPKPNPKPDPKANQASSGGGQ